MFGIGMSELIVILLIVVVVFGGRRLPEIGAGLGKAISNFKKALHESSETEPNSDKPSSKEEK